MGNSNAGGPGVAGRPCPLCRTPIQPNVAVTQCPVCHVAYHAECWKRNAGCSTFGCRGTAAAPAQQPPGPQPQSCPKCGYVFGPLETTCARCARGIPPPQPPGQQGYPPGQQGYPQTPYSQQAPAGPYYQPGYGRPVYPVQVYGDYAGFWMRVAASFIDGIVLGVVGLVIGFAMGASMSLHGIRQGPIVSSADVVGSLVGLVYYVGLNTAFGATLGKMALGMKIIKYDGTPLTFPYALGRYVLEVLFAVLTLGLAYLVVAFHAEKRGLHDLIMGTVVVYTG